jgi:hypothetical protein
MVAAQDREVATHVGEGSLLHVLDPRAKLPERHLMLGLAGDCACMASDAPPVINHKAVFHSDVPEKIQDKLTNEDAKNRTGTLLAEESIQVIGQKAILCVLQHLCRRD